MQSQGARNMGKCPLLLCNLRKLVRPMSWLVGRTRYAAIVPPVGNPAKTLTPSSTVCLMLRKLHGRLRSQLELPRQPSEGCLLFGSFWSSGTWCAWRPALVQEEGVKHH